MLLQNLGRRDFIYLFASQSVFLYSAGESESARGQAYQTDGGYEYNIEIEEYHFPESVRIGEEFTANIAITNPSDETVEVEGHYYLCVNTPDKAAEFGNSCWRVSDFPTTLEPGQSLSTTISPVIDSEVPEEYRVPGDRGQGISFDTNSDVVGGVAVEDSLELLPRYDPTTEPTTTEITDRTTDYVDATTTENTAIDSNAADDSESDSPSDSSTASVSTNDENRILSPIMRDVAALMGASGVTLTALYKYFTSD
jgi:hypothetical protein